MATTAVPDQSALGEDTHTEVCIVGTGMAGITTAYLLAKQGKSVVVLDDGAIGGGQTQRTTAHLSNALDARYFEIERLHGSEGAKLAASSHTAAIDRIESIIGEEQIACDFVRLDGYLFLPPGEPTDSGPGKALSEQFVAVESTTITNSAAEPCGRLLSGSRNAPIAVYSGLPL
jgi:hypothetical protein